ncbi:hypothetical protein NPIL_237031 [Nephila pilipes]|uniref:Uncharacterized protein n=1 Tax=Nephila pilipes TaxID=299642 RepID=A0A8X6Q3W4_NEPPI|nr:hypothetical protein NPIL_237031 [Nephila pilipes]
MDMWLKTGKLLTRDKESSSAITGETNHPTLHNRSVEYFKRKYGELKNRKMTFKNLVKQDNDHALEASNRVSYRIAQLGEKTTGYALTIAYPLGKRVPFSFGRCDEHTELPHIGFCESSFRETATVTFTIWYGLLWSLVEFHSGSLHL